MSDDEAHSKTIQRVMRRRRSRRPAKGKALIDRIHKAGLGRSEAAPEVRRTVKMEMPTWAVLMVEELAPQQGITPEQFMAAILREGLYEAFLELYAQTQERRPTTKA